MKIRRTLLAAVSAGALVLTTSPSVGSPASAPAPASVAERPGPGAKPRVLQRYAADTWRSFEAMTVRRTGLPADNVGGTLEPETRSAFTSPTNIGAYLWSAVAARDIGLISAREARIRMKRTIRTVGRLEKHEPSGQFYNWYNPKTLEKLTIWPESGDEVQPFMSSVDNGWLATGLLLAARAVPRLAKRADAIREDMDFGCYYNKAEGQGGQIRGGFWDEDFGDPARVVGDYCGMGEDVWYTGHHYGAFNTEPRMASYLGIASGQIPRKHYFGTFRTFPGDTCDWSWTEAPPTGEWRTYEGVDVYEGALDYRGMKVVPSWGGSMFEALMVPLFVPEETWGKRSWGVNHPLYVRGQIQHGLQEADYGYWGFSPSNNPAGGYREYGVDMLGLEPAGYASDQGEPDKRTDWDQPWPDCGRAGEPAPTAADYGDGVVTPHASFLALRYAPKAARKNLARLDENFDAYGRGGFYDAIAVGSGQVSKRYLSLDQGMVMAALGNALARDDMRRYVSPGGLARKVKPLMAQEVFSAAPRP